MKIFRIRFLSGWSIALAVPNGWRQATHRYNLWGAVFYFATVVILIGAVICLAILKLINGTVTATLLSGIIGYTLGKGGTYVGPKRNKE